MTATPTLEMREVAALVPDARNARTHSPEQVATIVGSITEFGFNDPVEILPDGRIVAGHGRVLAAHRMGLDTVPCVVLGHLDGDDIRRRAYALASNRTAELSDWDADMLALNVEALREADFDVDLTGFDDETLESLLPDDPDAGDAGDEDEVPEPPDVARSDVGDVWLLGSHRLACGDSTDAAVVEAALGGAAPNLMVTDPPYGVNYDANWRNEAPGVGWSDSRSLGKVTNDDNADWSAAYALFGGDVAYVWHPAGATSLVFANNLQDAGFELRMQIIWAKPHFPIGRGAYHVQHEPCWYAVRKGATSNWQADRKQTTLWQIDNATAFRGATAEGDEERTGHSTQKPVECMARPIRHHTVKGQHVYEPFSGSGTTIVACERLGRRAIAIELHPPYVDMAVLRWQSLTGRQATRERDGAAFDDCEPREMAEAAE